MRCACVALAAFVASGLVASVSPAFGGTICGTVRDAQTAAPVAHAGVFVLTPGGGYTGFCGSTDMAGSFCIRDIPAGTYDLEVLVDDHQVAYLRNVVVTATTDVTLPASLPPLSLAPPRPNPAGAELHLRWVLPRATSVRLTVLDVGGRLVQGWSDPALPAGEHEIHWDLRGADGHRLPAGCYFVVLDADGARRVRTFHRVP
jgi:hypothetical protein